ncbi:MAG: alkaline phosphatase family protein [Clostridia bacterium]|nr:alkaline phosphatase family protein [Clostridia bacterium]
MQRKVILISIDGMRPDGLRACKNPYLAELEARSTYTYSGRSMVPSVTFPCHFSMTHSVTPQRHGILSNTYVPEVRPVEGLFEKIKQAGGVSAMFYGWEPLRDIATPGALKFSTYINAYVKESSDTVLTDEALRVILTDKPDFVFLYMVETDEKGGHDHGWMSEEYLRRISIAIDNVRRVIETVGEEYAVIIMADHGGHDRSHGSTCEEDMTVPFFFLGKEFAAGRVVEGLSLLDIAPTVAAVMGFAPDSEWEGHSLV